jgi:pimeloyl-ACP methyl ester carboxylesterase
MSHTVAAFHRWLPLACVGILIVATVTRGRVPAVTIPAEGQGNPAPKIAEDKPIPRDVLIGMYRTELGKLFNDADVDKLLAAHQIIESYFSATSADLRKQAIQSLKQSGVDAAILGRLCRIRMYWPALEPGIYYVNEKHGPYDVRYFLGVPAGYDRSKTWPLVVKLPPVEPFLVNPPPDADGVVKIYNDWIKDELAKHPDALVLMPLLNLDELYGPSYTGMNYVIQPMLHAAERANIDPARVYLIGHSTGGHATWNLALHYSTYFASIAPLAGGASQDWQRLRLPNLRNTPPVVWADAKDTLVKADSSRALVKIMRNQKLDVDYLETKEFGHAPPDDVAEERYQKMRSHTRSLYPSWVSLQSNRPEVLFNRNDWIQLWQESDPGPETRMLFRRGTGHMTVTKNSARIDAKRDGNTIELTLDNVDSMRIYLNDQMVDLTSKLTIVINKKRTIHGFAKPNIEQMMNDQLFLGRGWRYFSAILDVDLSDASTTRPTTNPTSRPTSRPSRTGQIIIGPVPDEGNGKE